MPRTAGHAPRPLRPEGQGAGKGCGGRWPWLAHPLSPQSA